MPTINYSHPSPNYWTDSTPIKAVVLHGTSGEFAPSIGWLTNPASQASSNYIIDRDGAIYCLVDPYKNLKAWGNGIPVNPDMTIPFIKDAINQGVNLNLVTCSIEHTASSTDMIAHNYAAFTPLQKASSLWLTDKLCKDFKIPRSMQTIVPHAAIDSVSRANCPGIISIPDYVKELQNMANTIPPALAPGIGPGMTLELKNRGLTPATKEVYTTDITSVLYCTDGTKLEAYRNVDPAVGTLLNTWTVLVYPPK